LDGAYDLATLRDKGIAATRQLAKRQLTWLRSMPDRVALDCLQDGLAQRILERINQFSEQDE
jgi:tRNA dimethylallyltransferase